MNYLKIYKSPLLLSVLAMFAIAYTIHTARAATLTNRSDFISTSAVGAVASHTIQFTTTSLIPASGSILLTFDSSAFVLPALSHQDVDVLVNSTQQTLAPTPGTGTGSAWGVTASSGSAGSVTIFLNDTDVVTAGSTLEIRIGTNAVFQTAGATNIPNPLTVGSYSITIQTRAANTSVLDTGNIPIAITNPVGITSVVGTSTVVEAPVLSPPSGTYTEQVTVTIQTNTPGATIYYTIDGTTPTTSSPIYTSSFTLTTSTTVQAIATKAGYTDSAVTTETYTITTTPTPGVVLPPIGPVSVPTNGIRTASAQCGTNAVLHVYFPIGTFPEGSTLSITCLSWSSFPITTGAESAHALSDVIFGLSAKDKTQHLITTPAYPIYAVLTYQNEGNVRLASSYNLGVSNPQHQWSTTPISAIGNNPLQFETTLQTLGNVGIMYFERPKYSCNIRPADINCDGEVDIVDMSILMSYWHTNTTNTRADINRDSHIDLIDLTILFYWWSA